MREPEVSKLVVATLKGHYRFHLSAFVFSCSAPVFPLSEEFPVADLWPRHEVQGHERKFRVSGVRLQAAPWLYAWKVYPTLE